MNLEGNTVGGGWKEKLQGKRRGMAEGEACRAFVIMLIISNLLMIQIPSLRLPCFPSQKWPLPLMFSCNGLQTSAVGLELSDCVPLASPLLWSLKGKSLAVLPAA